MTTIFKGSNLKSKKSRKKTKVKTRVAIVLDESGSMDVIRGEARRGTNEQLQTLRKKGKGGETSVSLIKFSTDVGIVFQDVDSDELVDLNEDDYVPTATTALYDAVYKAIQLLKKEDDSKKMAYLVIVVSDGEENSSRNIDGEKLASLVKELQDTGQWTFTYMMSNIDLSTFSKKIHAFSGNAMTWTSTPIGTDNAYDLANNALRGYLTERQVMADSAFSSTTYYSDSSTTDTTEEEENTNNG